MKKIFRCLSIVIVLFSFSGVFAFAESNMVMVDPLRLVFKDGKNSARLTITNTSKTQKQYRIKTFPLRMDKNGGLHKPEKVTKREAIATKMVHFSPRVTTIPSGKMQTVRVAVRRPPGLPAGDYFTYINVSIVPLKEPLPQKKTEKGAVALSMNIGISLPIIVTVGEEDAQVDLSSVQLFKNKENKKEFRMALRRGGKYNSYNSISVYGMVNGEEKLIAHNKRVVTYVPLKEREFNVRIFEQSFTGGPVRVDLNKIEGKERKLIKSYNIKI